MNLSLSTVQTGFKALAANLDKNSPTLLTGMAVAGVITTVIMAIKATPRAVEILNEEQALREAQYPELAGTSLPKKEAARLIWKEYIPTVLMGTATIACVVGANRIGLRRHAALASVYSITETTLKEYQEKVKETFGEKKEQVVRDSLAEDKLKATPLEGQTVIMTGNGETLCFDAWSGRYFKSDMEKIRQIVNDFNRDLIQDGYKTLNEFYYDLGMANIDMGQDMGWSLDSGLLYVNYSAKLTENNQPCMVISFTAKPKYL